MIISKAGTKFLFALALMGAASFLLASSRAEGPQEAPTGDAFSLVAKEPERPFSYEPIDPDFWDEVSQALDSKNYPKIINLSVDALKNRTSTEDKAEAKLALAMALENLGFKYGASLYYMEIAKKNLGSQMAQASLSRLEIISREKDFDPEDLIEDFLTNNEFGPVHSDIQNFISFYSGLYNTSYGFKKWSEADFKKIVPNSFWDFKLQYLTALGEVARNRLDSAYDRFRKIYRNDKAPPKYQTLAQYQLARILFEKAELSRAYQLYTTLENMPVRERGRIILERAWALFYLREYGKALGLLGALDAPFFKSSVSPEQYILKMLTYKTLCHYDTVATIAKEFDDKYKGSLRTIRRRKNLSNDSILMNRALMNGRIQDLANAINDIREERRALEDYKWDSYEFYAPLLERYKLKDKELRSRIKFAVEPRLRESADELLDAEEQVAFLDYTSKLDSLRLVKRGDSQRYESERISYLRFDRIYWPVEAEYWTDEFESYSMIVRSRCNDEPRSQMSPEDLKKLDDEPMKLRGPVGAPSDEELE